MTEVTADGNQPSLGVLPPSCLGDLQDGCIVVTREGDTESSGSDIQIPDAAGCSLIDDTAIIGTDDLDTSVRKKPRRRSKAKKASDFQVSTKGEATTVYSRNFLETIKFCNVNEQKKLWQEVYNSFSPTVRTEYDELTNFKQQRKQSGKMCKATVDGDLDFPAHAKYTCDESYNDEDEDSDDSFSILRPALMVEGEPDFDSGPPEDGLEYLRRVRWEAAQIPNVRVAKLDRSKLEKPQTVYMPEIPDIERCPEHLLPMKQWEDEFLSDFSELRMAMSGLDCSHNIEPAIVQSAFNTVQTVEANDLSSPESTRPDGPTLSAILQMEPVARVSMLKRRIGLFENKDELSRNDGLWLFALCTAVDTPLDADTSAVLRGLLRKCSKLRAGKSELDDEAVMLNILVTISGKYFGQAENST